MIERHVGDLLSVERGVLVHGCNARSVMDAGVALAVRRHYPEAFAVLPGAVRGSRPAARRDLHPPTLTRAEGC